MKKLQFLVIPILFFFLGTLLQINLDQTILFKLIVLGFIAIVSYLIIISLPSKITKNPILFIILYILTITVLIFNLIFGLKIAGTKRWIYLGTFTFQPSEFMKFILITLLSFILGTSYIHSKLKNIIALIILIIPVILTFLQPDAGTSFILLIIGLSIILKNYSNSINYISSYLLIFGSAFILLFISLIIKWTFIFLILFIILNKKFFFSKVGIPMIIILFLIPLSINYLSNLPLFRQYQQQRIKTFTILIQPKKKLAQRLNEQEKFNFNLKQSRITIGSGGLMGKGLQNITQTRLKFLPEYKTDFMYATITEAFGFVGILIIIILYITLILQILHVNTDNPIVNLYKTGLISMLIVEITISMGSNLGLLPTKGIPLPFIAYGGTSLITHFLILGLFANLLNNH